MRLYSNNGLKGNFSKQMESPFVF